MLRSAASASDQNAKCKMSKDRSFNSCVSNQLHLKIYLLLLHLNIRWFEEKVRERERERQLYREAQTFFEFNMQTHGKFFGRCEEFGC